MAEERGDLEQDIYDDAKKAAAVTGCNAQEQQWAAAEVVVAVVDRRKGPPSGLRLLNTKYAVLIILLTLLDLQ